MFDIPTILSRDALLDKAFGRAGKATATGVDRMTRARNLAIMRVRVAGQAISSSLASYVKGFPSLDRLPLIPPLHPGVYRHRRQNQIE